MNKYVVITEGGLVWLAGTSYNYHAILEDIYKEYQTAGAGWDHPNMLIKNGIVIVPGKLSALAWDYGKELTLQVENSKFNMLRKFKEPE